MKKMQEQNVKGTQDYLPEIAKVRRDITRTLEEVFVQYGCEPLETPILNYSKLMASKYSGGDEILKEMYNLSDRGRRELALRYDLTIPFAKVIAMNPQLRMPFKRYEIGKVFRDGPIKTGRLREFTQCDVDVTGIESQMAEAELMLMALDAFERIGLQVEIQYNNRKYLSGMLALFGVDKGQLNQVILVIDKLNKIGADGVMKELNHLNLSGNTLSSIQRFLEDEENSTLSSFESYESTQVQEGVKEIAELESFLQALSIEGQCNFNPFLARGLEIYTGTIYEIFLVDKTITSSIGSGGRYDQAIGGLIGTNETMPTVGISFGLDVISTAFIARNVQDLSPSPVDYYVIPLSKNIEALTVANDLRKKGYNVLLEMSKMKLRRALERANKENIKKVIIIGENEVKNNKYNVKDMGTGEEVEVVFLFK
ncbi:histidine--tRNA ligase [Cytobacillus sp. FSL R5-0569]|uniref:histidine--tRNA ligase n=1 Tax=Cytobacillus sp. FSL R5-0569 TaxID=2921649 RepID=UPI0030FCFE82